ncbi:hypothetical protein SDC9_101807 [bioreactor metagenome]|uniref:Uncharacterized protein n=1 Tax=bioreactor metagenome TaxID=1076179 RepID=A0A645AP40_9ZZZZ
MRRIDLYTVDRPDAALKICCDISDGLVFRVHVDAGVDFTFITHKKGRLSAKQGVLPGLVYHVGGNRCLYPPDSDAVCSGAGTDPAAAAVFWLFAADGIALYAFNDHCQALIPKTIP